MVVEHDKTNHNNDSYTLTSLGSKYFNARSNFSSENEKKEEFLTNRSNNDIAKKAFMTKLNELKLKRRTAKELYNEFFEHYYGRVKATDRWDTLKDHIKTPHWGGIDLGSLETSNFWKKDKQVTH